eukprot:TRINITY_DN3537_c0_g1_i2.p1 TRINITY_DN3537_c0_g1~~TRINITY_DN3537_c0_g1_i2.p1  ORF type:complete len:287 (+),score=57.07 TRINITY_DN3537_c0_g1_i2:44-904(+)
MDALKEIVLLREIPAVLFSHEHHFAFPTESLSDASLIVRDWIVPYVQILIFHEILYAVVFGIPTLLLFSPFGRHGWMREWKYMPDSYPKSSQIFAEIRRTCFSSAMIDAAYSALFLGWRARTKDTSEPLLATGEYTAFHLVELIVLAMLWADTHFYFTHRLLHTKWLFQKIHIVHHRSRLVNPFSGLSFHPIEAVIYFSAQAIYLAYPMHIVNVYAIKLGLSILPINGHLGHGFRSVRPLVGGYHHHLHHTLKNVNYGAALGPSIWDVLLGTSCDGDVAGKYEKYD